MQEGDRDSGVVITETRSGWLHHVRTQWLSQRVGAEFPPRVFPMHINALFSTNLISIAERKEKKRCISRKRDYRRSRVSQTQCGEEG